MAEVIEFKPTLKVPNPIEETIDESSTQIRQLLSTVVHNLKDIKSLVVMISAHNGDKLMYHSNPTIEEQATFLNILQYNLFQEITEIQEDLEDEEDEDII